LPILNSSTAIPHTSNLKGIQNVQA